jgi:hypothetical protein
VTSDRVTSTLNFSYVNLRLLRSFRAGEKRRVDGGERLKGQYRAVLVKD